MVEGHEVHSEPRAGERGPVIVCVGTSPTTEALLHVGLNEARSRGVEWLAAHVRVEGDTRREDEALRHLGTAQRLGARVVELPTTDVVDGLVRLVRVEGASLVILGKPLKGTYRWPRKSIADRFVEASGAAPVLLVGDPHPATQRHHASQTSESRRLHAQHVIAIALLGAMLMWLSRTVPPSLSLLTAAIATIGVGRLLRPSTATFVGGLLGFVPAAHVAAGASPQTAPVAYLLAAPTLIAIIGALISRLQARIPEQDQAIMERERQLSRLHALGTELAATSHEDAAWEVCADALAHGVGARVEWHVDAAEPADRPWWPLVETSRQLTEAVGCGTSSEPDHEWLVVPVAASSTCLGWFALRGSPPSLLSDVRVHLFVGSVARLLAVTLERLHLVHLAEERKLDAIAERLRSDLLSSVSHDLRTPLGTIVGAASWLRDANPSRSPQMEAELLASIETEALRLERTLGNLLALTRLSGRPEADRSQWFMEEEIVQSALDRLGRSVDRNRVFVHLSDSRPLVAVDAVLVELALANLIDNATRHGGSDVSVWLTSRFRDGAWELHVEDDGAGIAFDEHEAVFERFVRGRWGRRGRGSGMGLAICRAVAEAHGGEIRLLHPSEARDNARGGAHIRLTLPTMVLDQAGLDMDEPTTEERR